MRVVLTSLAVALVAALCVALVAPLVIDWSSHRAEIAARLSALTGGEVTLNGDITARLLPTPFVKVDGGAVAGPGPAAPRLTFASARLELALVKLASGAIRFTDIRLDRPVLTLRRRADGSLNLPQAPPGRAGGIGFDRLVVSDGKVVVEASQGAPRREIDAIALTGDAPSLAGPYHVSGSFEGPGQAPVVFRLATEPKAEGGVPVRLAVDSGKSWPALVFDGAYDGATVSGAATLTGAVATPEGETPWRAAGRLVANSSRVALDPAQFRFGPDERGVQAEGSAGLVLDAPPRLSLDIRAKQPNLDALLRRKGEDAAAPARALSLVLAALSPALDPTRPHAVDARLSASQAILGGATLPDLSASLKSMPGSPLAIRLDLGLPGQTRLAADGRFETGAAAKFVGTVDASSGDFDLFRQWAGVGAPAFAARASALADALPYAGGRLAGPVEVSAVGFSGQDLNVTLDRSTLTGALAFTAPVGAEPGRLFFDLKTPSLDLASLPNVGLATIMLSDLDLSLSLGADALHVADVNDAALETGSLSLKLTKTGPDVRLDRFRVENLGGASVEAEGASGKDGISLAGRIRAGRLDDFAALAARLAPGPWTRLAAARAGLLSPAALAFDVRTRAESMAITLSAKGSLGRTQASLSVEPGPRGSGQAIAATLDSPDAAAFLRQLGLPAADLAKNGSAHVTFDAAGTSEGGYDVNGAAALAGVDLAGRGRFLPQAQRDDARLFGAIKLKGANVAPLLATLGLAPQGGRPLGPADASADFTLRGDEWTVSKLAASVAGVKAKGELTYRPAAAADALAAPDISRALEAVGGPGASSGQPSPPAIGGELSLDGLSLGSLVSLVLGPPAPPRPGEVWSDAKFAAPPLNLPHASVQLSVGALSLMDGLNAQSFRARLGLDNGRLELGEIGANLFGGSVSGHATLRRIGESATLSGALGADRLTIRRAGFAGEVGGALDFASTGRNPAALVLGLAGSGNVRFAGARLMRSDLDALGRVVARAQEPDAQLDETNIGFFLGKELDRAPAALPDGTAPAALSAGSIKMGPITLPGQQGQADLTATFDLKSLSLDTELRLVSPSDKLKFWSGPPPAASVLVQDALNAPKRKVDVSALSAGLATQAIARETDRIANMEADIRERAFFNRRLKGLEFMDRREKELQDFLAEQARLKGLSQRLEAEKAEEARIAAEKAAAEKAAAEKAAAEKAAAEKAVQPPLPLDLPPDGTAPRPPAAPAQPDRPDTLGAAASQPAPLPPARPKPPPESPAPLVPTAGALY